MMNSILQRTTFVFSILVFQTAFTGLAAAGGLEWRTNLQAAQAQAKALNKPLLLAFTGSDWCPWCKKLNEEVFSKPAFGAIEKRFVLVSVDFPHEKKLPDAVKEQNDKLAKKYGISTFPRILLVKPDGELMAIAGYQPGGAEKYVKLLADLMKTYDNVAKMRAQLPDATGLDRARLLDQLIGGYVKLGNEIPALGAWRKQIVSLDSDNQAGLKQKYEFRVILDDARNALASGKPKIAEMTIDKALALPNLKPAQIQRGSIVKSNCLLARKDYQASLDCLKKALDLAPKSPNADTLKELIKKSEKLLESQNAKVAN